MNKTTNVYLRENKQNVSVNITNDSMPIISDEIIEKWQRIINIMAKIIDVPAGLLCKLQINQWLFF